MEVVVVVGNGTSLVYTPHLAGPALAAEIATALPPSIVSQLRAVADAARPDGVPHSPDDDFEHLLGPLDRIASTLLPLSELTHLSVEEIVAVTVTYGVLYRLYRQGVGIALDVIARRSVATAGEALDNYGRFVTWALGLLPAGERGLIRFFNVCYDGLLDGRILAHGPAAGFTVSDQARGYPEELLNPAGDPVWCLPLRAPTEPEYVVGGRAAVIYHPHGSLGWVRDPATGAVYKAPLPALRGELTPGGGRTFYRAYAERGTTMEPVVVLTDRKTAEVSREPFFTAYAQLAAALATADAVVVAGYAFRDEPLNTVLAAGSPTEPTGSPRSSSSAGPPTTRRTRRASSPSSPPTRRYAPNSPTGVSSAGPVGSPATSATSPGGRSDDGPSSDG